MARARVGIEMGTLEAISAVLLVLVCIGVLAMVHAGIIADPVLVGSALMLVVVLIFTGFALIKMGILPRAAIPVWYFFIIGVMLIFYGLVSKGAVPAALAYPGADVQTIALTSAMIYTIIFVLLALAAAVFYYKTRVRATY